MRECRLFRAPAEIQLARLRNRDVECKLPIAMYLGGANSISRSNIFGWLEYGIGKRAERRAKPVVLPTGSLLGERRAGNEFRDSGIPGDAGRGSGRNAGREQLTLRKLFASGKAAVSISRPPRRPTFRRTMEGKPGYGMSRIQRSKPGRKLGISRSAVDPRYALTLNSRLRPAFMFSTPVSVTTTLSSTLKNGVSTPGSSSAIS